MAARNTTTKRTPAHLETNDDETSNETSNETNERPVPMDELSTTHTTRRVNRLNRALLGSRAGRRDSLKSVGDATWRALHDKLNEPQLKDQQDTGNAGFVLRRDTLNRCVTVTWVPSEEETHGLDDEQYLAAIRQRLARWREHFRQRGWRQDEITDEGGVPWIRLPLDEPAA